MRTLGLAISVVSFALWFVVSVVLHFNFDRSAGGYLKRAADSNTIELAVDNLETALTYLESKGMNDGYTSIFWNSPDEDVGFWYQNIETSLEELKSIDSNASKLEKTNVLMKLRETLLDSGKSGNEITLPTGISKFPNNSAFALWGCLSVLFLFIFYVWPDN